MSTWILGEFDGPDALLAAVKHLRQRGRKRLDAYTPYPVEGLPEALDLPDSGVPVVALLGGLGGAFFGYLVQWFTGAVDYPINVANRPLHSPPSYIPITFESAVLFASLTIFGALIALFGFPRLHHPVFEVAAFERATNDRFWVSVTVLESEPGEGSEAVAAELRALGATTISIVEDPR